MALQWSPQFAAQPPRLVEYLRICHWSETRRLLAPQAQSHRHLKRCRLRRLRCANIHPLAHSSCSQSQSSAMWRSSGDPLDQTQLFAIELIQKSMLSESTNDFINHRASDFRDIDNPDIIKAFGQIVFDRVKHKQMPLESTAMTSLLRSPLPEMSWQAKDFVQTQKKASNNVRSVVLRPSNGKTVRIASSNRNFNSITFYTIIAMKRLSTSLIN